MDKPATWLLHIELQSQFLTVTQQVLTETNLVNCLPVTSYKEDL